VKKKQIAKTIREHQISAKTRKSLKANKRIMNHISKKFLLKKVSLLGDKGDNYNAEVSPFISLQTQKM